MTKKSKKALIIICVVAVLSILNWKNILVFAVNYPKFMQHRSEVLKYVKENYHSKITLVNSEMGRSALTEYGLDTFYFRDLTNRKDFWITHDSYSINDYYAIEIIEKQIAEKAKELFPNNDLDYSVRGAGERSTSKDAPYELIRCTIDIREKNADDLSKTYKLVSTMNNEFIGMNLTIGFKPIVKDRKDLDSYGFYDKRFKLTGEKIMTEEEFLKFMAEINPPRPGQYVPPEERTQSAA